MSVVNSAHRQANRSTAGDGNGGRRMASALFAVLFSISAGVLLASQLSLMSVLDTGRAERAAREIADSEFTAQLIGETVEQAIGPVLGQQNIDPSIAAQVATATSTDPRVREVVRTSLVAAHRQVVDAESASDVASAGDDAGGDQAVDDQVIDEQVQAAIDEALAAASATSGVDLSGVTVEVGSNEVVPADLPEIGLRLIAERARAIAGVLAVVFGLIAVTVHPRPGRALAGLGWKLVIVSGTWVVALLVVGWVIDRIDQTLFGEMLGSIWSNAVPSMLLLVVAGVVIGVGTWLGGLALDGFIADRADREAEYRY